MKNTLTAAILAILLVSTGAIANADDRYRGQYGYSGHSRYRDADDCRSGQPDIYVDRYGNRTFVTREQRYAFAAEDNCRRPVVIPQCRPAPVCEPRYQGNFYRPSHPLGALRFIFGR